MPRGTQAAVKCHAPDCETGEHVILPRAMALVIEAFGAGALHTVGKGGQIQPLCFIEYLHSINPKKVRMSA